MAEPLKTWIIHHIFSCLYTVIQGVYSLLYPYPHMKCPFTKIQSNIAIYCNTFKHNMQYSIGPYCFTPSSYQLILNAILPLTCVQFRWYKNISRETKWPPVTVVTRSRYWWNRRRQLHHFALSEFFYTQGWFLY